MLKEIERNLDEYELRHDKNGQAALKNKHNF